MRISIITPTYNNAKYLEGAIRSVVDQGYPDVEHIVIDGGSADGTLDILKKYECIKWISESDGGMYDALNKGLEMATGEVVCYLNSDDRHYENTLHMISEIFGDNSDVDYVFGYCTYIDEDERPICTFRTPPFAQKLALHGRITWAQPSFFWRKAVNDEIGRFDDSLRTVGDADFFRRILSHGYEGRAVKLPLSKFMLRGDCITKTMADSMAGERKLVAERYKLDVGSARYLASEFLYYLSNVDSYVKYIYAKLR